MFDAMGALSTKHNSNPESASRPYDSNRDGFCSLWRSRDSDTRRSMKLQKRRGATIYGEIVSYNETSDGYSLVAPSGDGAKDACKV